MALLALVAGILVTHALVWGMVRQMRREGQRIRRVQLIGFWALEIVLGVLVWQSGSWPLFVWLAVNAAVLAWLPRIPPPRYPPSP